VLVLRYLGPSFDGAMAFSLREVDRHGFPTHLISLWADEIEVSGTPTNLVVTLFMKGVVISTVIVNLIEGIGPDGKRVRFKIGAPSEVSHAGA